MAFAAAVLVAASAATFARQRSLEMATLFAGAAAWLAGNLVLFAGPPPGPGWIAFFALTIGGERLELSRYLKRTPAVRFAFVAIAVLLLVTPLAPRLMGAVLLLLALWLFAFDLARVTVRQTGLPRYVAVCLLAGYAWLALGGTLLAAAVARFRAARDLGVRFSMGSATRRDLPRCCGGAALQQRAYRRSPCCCLAGDTCLAGASPGATRRRLRCSSPRPRRSPSAVQGQAARDAERPAVNRNAGCCCAATPGRAR